MFYSLVASDECNSWNRWLSSSSTRWSECEMYHSDGSRSFSNVRSKTSIFPRLPLSSRHSFDWNLAWLVCSHWPMALVKQLSMRSGNTSRLINFKIPKNESSSIVMRIYKRWVDTCGHTIEHWLHWFRSSIAHEFGSRTCRLNWTNWFYHRNRSSSIILSGQYWMINAILWIVLLSLQSWDRSKETCLLRYRRRSRRSSSWFDASILGSAKHPWTRRIRWKGKSICSPRKKRFHRTLVLISFLDSTVHR